MTTLDALIARHGVPRFIKIDVEGYEAEVLAGLPRRSPRCRSSSPRSSATSRASASAVARRSDMQPSTPRSAKTLPSCTERKLAAAEMIAWLKDLPDEANSGDIYATRHDGLGRRAVATAVAGATVGAALAASLLTAAAEPIQVEVSNASVPTLCAETDNVYLKFMSAKVRAFTIEASHPAYAGTIVVDRSAPDFRDCEMSCDPVFSAEPRRVTLYETGEMQLVGYTFSSFWRPNAVPVHVGARVETGLHLLQFFTKYKERTEEVLVLYPADGYWRARPLPPVNLPWSAYGSSFLIGPVETAGRPFVDIRDIAFDPATRTFRLAFARGGEASLRLAAADQEHVALDVRLDAPDDATRPFAALRSMFVTETNADVARLAWRGPGAAGYETAPIMKFRQAEALELWAGRRLPSRHNMSAPDMVFGGFRDSH